MTIWSRFELPFLFQAVLVQQSCVKIKAQKEFLLARRINDSGMFVILQPVESLGVFLF